MVRWATLTLVEPHVIEIVQNMIPSASTPCSGSRHVLPPFRSKWPQAALAVCSVVRPFVMAQRHQLAF